MAITLAGLGARPVVELHAAGLKAGEFMARARVRGLSRQQAEQEALPNRLCQAFGHDQGVQMLLGQQES
jgi:hypothetical protein